MKNAFLFPGQGAQYSGMFKTIKAMPEAVRVYEKANNIVGYNLQEMCTFGTQEQLNQTQFTQVAIYTHSIALSNVLIKNNINPVVVAGHSVGQFAALVAVGVISFEEGLKLVQARANLMGSVKRKGSMVSITGLSVETIKELCEEVKDSGYAAISLFNTQIQMVVSGDIKAIEKLTAKAIERGAIKVVPLRVSQAFHSELIREIYDEFKSIVNNVEFKEALCPIVLNCDAEITTNSIKIKEDIIKQIVTPVKWYESMKNILQIEDIELVEVGPGKTLTGMFRSIQKGKKVYTADIPQDLAKLIKLSKSY